MNENKRKKTYISRLIFLIVIIGVMYYLSRDSLSDTLAELKRTSVQSLIMILVLPFCYFIAEGFIIVTLSKRVCPEIRPIDGIECSFFCSFARTVTIGGGSGAAEVYYLISMGIDGALACGISIIQYFLYKLSILIFGVFTLIFYGRDIASALDSLGGFAVLGYIIVIGVAAVLIVVATKRRPVEAIINFILNIFKKYKWDKLSLRLKGFKDWIFIFQEEAERQLKEKNRLILVITYNILKMIFLYLIPSVICFDGMDIGFSIALMSVSVLLASAVPLPSGYGSLDVIFVLLFKPFVGTAKAASAMVLYRFSTIIIPFIIGGICYYTMKNTKKGKVQNEQGCDYFRQ